MKSSEKWGVDVETAVNLALKDLKKERDEVEVEVLEESSSGFLGIGSKLAKVRVTVKETSKENTRTKTTLDDIDSILAGLPENSTQRLPDEIREHYDEFEQEENADAAAKEKKQQRDKTRRVRKNRERKQDFNLEDKILDEVKEMNPVTDHPVELFLRDIRDKMGIDLDFTVRANEELVYVEITGQDTRTIIGKRGSTLDAVQCLASYVVNKDDSNYVRVIVDAENYRAKREQTLIGLAKRLAGKVDRTGKTVVLEPMNPYERKIIHYTLQNHPRITTRSEGKDPYRKVVIEKNR